MYIITASIATYKNEMEVLQKAINSFLNTDLNIKLYILDNSPSDDIGNICKDRRIAYIFNKKNLGYGASHNIAIHKMMDKTKYHLVLNPDIFFERGTLERLYDFMEENKEVGLVMPKICYFKNSVQHLCKLLPGPFDLIARRANLQLLRNIFRNNLDRYELRFTGYDKVMDVPHLSGCFMFIRCDVFRKIGTFDERFFLYLEDVDFSRRIHRYYRTVYYPRVIAYHHYAKHSYGNLTAFKYHILSAIRYFNKWGWFFDKERKKINKKTLEKCLG